MKISVIGAGYVGLSLAVLIAEKHEVTLVDIVPEKVDLIKSGKSPIEEPAIDRALSNGNLELNATLDYNECAGSEFIIIATPTNYDPEKNIFDTRSIESALNRISTISPSSTAIIKSTAPIGYTEKISKKYSFDILFSPEFLREGRSLHDNQHPSRIIVGIPGEKDIEKATEFANLLSSCSLDHNVKTMIIGSTEAESIKLFSNTYLAMRVAFFNELDTFADKHDLSSEEIIKGVSLDPRIGDYYNNPSFGYGGYCLPKDTKQLVSSFSDTPNEIIKAIVKSNRTRKQYITDKITSMAKDTVGIYRLTMKAGSDNFRESSIVDIMDGLSSRGLNVVIHEPLLKQGFKNYEVINNFDEFARRSEVILANRKSAELEKYSEKVYCRDVFRRD